MHALTPDDIHPPGDYARLRTGFRARVIEHKAHRRLQFGGHLALDFENRLTVSYRVLERLATGRVLEEAEIRDELEAFNPLIPDGRNWKATLAAGADTAERAREAVRGLAAVEHRVWMQVDGLPRIHGIVGEVMARRPRSGAPALECLRFDLSPDAIAALKAGATLVAGAEHPRCAVPAMAVSEILRESLIADLA